MIGKDRKNNDKTSDTFIPEENKVNPLYGPPDFENKGRFNPARNEHAPVYGPPPWRKRKKRGRK